MSDKKLDDYMPKNISNLYKDWFLEYASYVILERAIPKIDDGLKPVQRRILHSMQEINDGRYHKVANIIGHTMQYHPHGDQAIGDALVNLGQKDLLIDTQGNWGDTRTGDKAAAPRYIEARLTPFALEVAFNKNITEFQTSYDGRKKEPVSLPIKFPLVLSQGVEGIAVGLSTKVLPHNFNELVKASISILKDKPFTIYPDFFNGCMIDVSDYKNGKKGGKIRLRSHIDIIDKTTLKISSLPYSITTSSLIDSIVKANNNNKIKIKNIEDNTAKEVEIIINLVKGVSPNVTIDALYAFTNCEISISPNCCIIVNDKPKFISVNDLLRISTEKTVKLLELELKYELNVLFSKWHSLSLEKIFIENKIYRKIEDCETWDSIIETIKTSLLPFIKNLRNDLTEQDIIDLTEIRIKRISKYDSNKQKDKLVKIESDIEEVSNNIRHIKEYSIRYFEHLLNKYGQENKRDSEIVSFDSISARRVIVSNKKLFINKKDGFIGMSLKKDEFVSNCSELDHVIVFLEEGKYILTKIDQKKYIGKNIIHAAVWKKNDKHMVYNIVYYDNKSKYSYVKRFSITGLIKDRFYDLTQGNDGSKILYFTANPNSESEIINIFLHSKSNMKMKSFEFDYSSLAIKSKNAKGNILTKHRIRKISQKSIGESTLGGRKIYIDESIGRLNVESRGTYIGTFNSEDKILVIYNDGTYEVTSFDLSNRYKMNDISIIEKLNNQKIYTLLHFDGKNKNYYLKRFKIEKDTLGKRYLLINDSRGSKMILISSSSNIEISFNFRTKRGEKKSKKVLNYNIVSVKGFSATGNMLDNKSRMSGFKFHEIEDNEESLDQESIDNKKNDNLELF